MQYLLNKETGVFHIEGYCQYATSKREYVQFKTETEVYEFFAHPRPCKKCEKKKEELLKEIKL